MAVSVGPQLQFYSGGVIAAGGSLYVYQTGTTTPVTIYSDAGLTTPITNPIVLDTNGEAKFYVGPTINLRLDSYNINGVFIQTLDPVYVLGGTGAGPEATLASNSTTDLGSTNVTTVKVTGTTTITSFGYSAATSNPIYFVRFAGALTLTQNATSLILPGAANIATAAGDALIAEYLGGGNWQVLVYQPAGGYAPSANPTFTTGITTPKVTFNSTSGIIGTTTNDSAAAGSVGETISSAIASGSAVSMTDNIVANITSISLTAGDWDVSAVAQFTGASGTNVSLLEGGISTTSATLPSQSSSNPGSLQFVAYSSNWAAFSVNSNTSSPAITIPPARISLASTTTIYLVAFARFTVSTCSAYGYLRARRIR